MRANRLLIGELANAQRKAAGGMAKQGDWCTRRRLAHQRDEVGKIVLDLTDIADIAARAGPATDRGCRREGLDAVRGQRLRQRMHRDAGAGGTVNEDGDAGGRRPAGRVVSVASSVPSRAVKRASGGIVVRSTALAVSEMERSSLGCSKGAEIIAPVTSAPAPRMKNPNAARSAGTTPSGLAA